MGRNAAEQILGLVHVVRPAAQLEIVHVRRATARERLDVVELEKRVEAGFNAKPFARFSASSEILSSKIVGPDRRDRYKSDRGHG